MRPCIKPTGRQRQLSFLLKRYRSPSVERLQLENELRHALQRDELVIYYQAKRYIATGAISGVEALLRWRHPDRGLLSPIDFISLARETGLLVPIGKWVTETACAQIMGWQALGLPAIRIAINLSPRQLMHENLLGDIEDALQKSGLPANLLELEITESMLMHDVLIERNNCSGQSGLGECAWR